MDNKSFYIDESIMYFNFLIQARQWTGFGKNELKNWMDNFRYIENGEVIACKILNTLISYSEKDIICMFRNAVSNILHQEIILNKQIEKDFNMLKSDLEYELRNALKNTLFVPLLAANAPGESGDQMIRLITQRYGSEIKRQFHFNITEDTVCDRIILVDDCIGSGQQFRDFWEEAKINSSESLRKWSKKHGIKVYYVVLVAYSSVVESLRHEYNDITIVCVEYITEKHRFFSINNEIWCDEKPEEIEERLKSALLEKNISVRGHDDLDFAVIIHNNIPDWSLPVLYKKRIGWEPLLRRKNSDD